MNPYSKNYPPKSTGRRNEQVGMVKKTKNEAEDPAQTRRKPGRPKRLEIHSAPPQSNLPRQITNPPPQKPIPVSQKLTPVSQQPIPVSQQSNPLTQQPIPVFQQSNSVTELTIRPPQLPIPPPQQSIPVSQKSNSLTQQPIPSPQPPLPPPQQSIPVSHQSNPLTQQPIPSPQPPIPPPQQSIPVSNQSNPLTQQPIPSLQPHIPPPQQSNTSTEQLNSVTEQQKSLFQPPYPLHQQPNPSYKQVVSGNLPQAQVQGAQQVYSESEQRKAVLNHATLNNIPFQQALQLDKQHYLHLHHQTQQNNSAFPPTNPTSQRTTPISRIESFQGSRSFDVAANQQSWFQAPASYKSAPSVYQIPLSENQSGYQTASPANKDVPPVYQIPSSENQCAQSGYQTAAPANQYVPPVYQMASIANQTGYSYRSQPVSAHFRHQPGQFGNVTQSSPTVTQQNQCRSSNCPPLTSFAEPQPNQEFETSTYLPLPSLSHITSERNNQIQTDWSNNHQFFQNQQPKQQYNQYFDGTQYPVESNNAEKLIVELKKGINDLKQTMNYRNNITNRNVRKLLKKSHNGKGRGKFLQQQQHRPGNDYQQNNEAFLAPPPARNYNYQSNTSHYQHQQSPSYEYQQEQQHYYHRNRNPSYNQWNTPNDAGNGSGGCCRGCKHCNHSTDSN